jgi:hypothetical protein
MHRDTAGRDLHESMGFHEGRGICADQLAEALEDGSARMHLRAHCILGTAYLR